MTDLVKLQKALADWDKYDPDASPSKIINQANALADAARKTATVLESLTAENAALKAERDKLYETRRWNIERDGSDFLICEGGHHRSEKCEFERYVPAATLLQQRNEAFERAAISVRDMICAMEWPPTDGDALIDALQLAIRNLSKES